MAFDNGLAEPGGLDLWTIVVTLAPPHSVGFAVAGNAPADVRQWITVDLAGFPGIDRRGYVVATEPVDRSWRGIELANQAREIILTELRRLRHLPPDEALGRAFAAANGIVYGKNRDVASAGDAEDAREPAMVGVMALVFEDQFATIAFVPPGQLMLVEDGLTYTVPDFDSWFPGYQQVGSAAIQAEPLGYASWTAPLMAQTEVRAGDSIILCSASTGRAYIEDVVDSGRSIDDLTWFHHRDPDAVLDAFREVVIFAELPSAAAAVVSFPPLPNSAQIQTAGDVARRAKDSWRHGRAAARQLRPARASAVAAIPRDADAVAALDRPASGSRHQPPVNRAIQRLQGVLEPSSGKGGSWRKPTPASEFGVPGAHGVDIFRGQSHYMGDPNWRHNLPRLPIIGSAWIWPLFALIVAGVVLGALWVREEYLLADIDETDAITSIDERIVDARDASDDDASATELAAAQAEIDLAREAGVPDETLDQRQQVVTELLDNATNVIRMSDIQRIGSLPEEFGEARVQGVYTPAGVFFVAGSLYQYRPDPEGGSPELVTILSRGEAIDGATVGNLWGLAFDARGLYVTDGVTTFMLPVESQEWRAVRLGRINNQPWSPGPIAAFDGSIYLLQAQYRQIYRFAIDTSEDEATPSDWLLTGARDRIESATDLVIERSIYVLLDDGTIQEMYLGDLASDIQPPYIDQDTAVALVGRSGSGYVYEAVETESGDGGRIVAFDLEGQNAAQLRLPMGFSTGDANVLEPFDGIQDVIVDESTGTLYIINGDGIWTARFSLPELPAELTPDATPMP